MTTEVSSKEKLRGKTDYIGWLKSINKHLRKAKYYENGKKYSNVEREDWQIIILVFT